MRISTRLLSAMLMGALCFAGSPRPAHSAGWLELLGISPADATSRLVISVERSIRAPAPKSWPIQWPHRSSSKSTALRRCGTCVRDATTTGRTRSMSPSRQTPIRTWCKFWCRTGSPWPCQFFRTWSNNAASRSRRNRRAPIMIVILRSPDGSRNIRELGYEATVRLKDELARLPGIGDVTCIGCIDCGARSSSIRRRWPPATSRLATWSPRSQRQNAQGSQAFLNGKPIVALAVYLLSGARPQTVSAAVQTKLAELRPSLAKGVDADVNFDFTSNPEPADRPTTPRYLLLDLVERGARRPSGLSRL